MPKFIIVLSFAILAGCAHSPEKICRDMNRPDVFDSCVAYYTIQQRNARRDNARAVGSGIATIMAGAAAAHQQREAERRERERERLEIMARQRYGW